MDKTPEDELTIKQRKWLALYVELGNATEAAMQVYDCKDRGAAATIGWENMRKLDTKDLMDAKGLTDDKLFSVLQEGLQAQRSISTISGNEANGGTVDFVEIPDYAVRHKYLETGLKLKDKFPRIKTDITTNGKELPTPLLTGVTSVSSNTSNSEAS